MRNRLLPMAVLAIALGLAAAAYADIQVNTLIVDPDGTGPGTWDVRARLWDDAGLGIPGTSGGMFDYVLGVKSEGGGSVDTTTHASPQTIDSGFFLNGVGPLGSNGVQYLAAYQNAAYPGVHDPALDAKVFGKVGVEAGSVGGGPAWDADVKVGHGTYTPGGSLRLDTPGRIASSVLPSNWATSGGPMEVDSLSWVSAIVTQKMTGGGGNAGGGADLDRPALMNVQAGALRLGAEASAAMPSMAQFLTLSIDSSKVDATGYEHLENASVVLTDNQAIKALILPVGQAHMNGLNLNGKMLSIYGSSTPFVDGDPLPADLVAAEAALRTAMSNASFRDGDGAYTIAAPDGLFDTTAVGSTAKEIGTYIGDDGTGVWVLKVKAVAYGDTDLNGNVSSADASNLYGNWNPAGGGPGNWWQGDFDRNGNVSSADASNLYGNWNPSGAPIGLGGGAVPEPCTLGLFSLGLVGLLRRHRKA
jgi:hypothetical protein